MNDIERLLKEAEERVKNAEQRLIEREQKHLQDLKDLQTNFIDKEVERQVSLKINQILQTVSQSISPLIQQEVKKEIQQELLVITQRLKNSMSKLPKPSDSKENSKALKIFIKTELAFLETAFEEELEKQLSPFDTRLSELENVLKNG